MQIYDEVKYLLLILSSFFMRNISQFINVLFLIFFLSNVSHSQTEKIKNVQIFGTNKDVQKYVFFKGEIINVSFDELSYNTNSYYYSIDHYDFKWNKTNIFKSEFISGYDDIRIFNFKKSLNTLQKYTNYTFSFPNEQFKIKVSGNYILSVKDSYDNIIFKRKFIVIENINAGNIEIYRPKDLKIRNTHQNLKIKFFCNKCPFDNRSEYRLVVIQNNNFNNYKLINNTTLKTSKELIFDNILFDGDDEYLSFDTKNVLGTNNEVRKVISGDLYSSILYEDIENLIYSFNPDKNGVFINNSLNDNNDLESDYTLVNFSLKTKNNNESNIYIIGNFNNHEISEKHLLKKTEKNLYKYSIKLKQGYYNYKYVSVVNGVAKNLSNFWQTENEYWAILYQKKLTDRYYKIVGFTKKNSDKIVN